MLVKYIVVVTCVMQLWAISAQPAHTFSMKDDQGPTIEPFGLADQKCIISLFANYNQSTSGVALRNLDDNTYPATSGGTWWKEGEITNDDTDGGAIPLISEELIAYCFGLEVEDIYGLVQNGADATSYEEEDYIGFNFQINKDTGTFRAGDKISYEIISKRDETAPTVELSSANSGFATDTFKVTVSFSETVSGFELNDIEVTNGEVSHFEGSEDTYTFDFTPIADGLSVIDVREGAAQDAAGNLSEAASQFGIEIDKTAPTIRIVGSNFVYTRYFEIEFEISEAVTSLGIDDIFVSGAEKKKLVKKNDDDYVLGLTFELSSYEAKISVNPGAVRDLAGNYNESTEVFRVKRLQTPLNIFGYHKGVIRGIIKKSELTSLKNSLQINKRKIKSARFRFIKNRKDSQPPADGSNDPSDQYNEAKFKAIVSRSNNRTISNGEMIKRKSINQGKRNVITHVSFDAQHDHERGFTSASLAWMIAWEKMITKNRMVGFFIGNQAGKSNISSEFTGNIKKFEASAGAYLIGALSESIFVESFASLALAKNKLTISDGILDLESEYMNGSIVAGASISGLIERPMYSFTPAITVAYGRSQMGNIGLIGSAYGLTDSTLKLEAGYISNLSIEFRPEITHTLRRSHNIPIESTIRFAPYLLCDLTYGIRLPNECRHGMEFSVFGQSRNSLTSFEGLVSYNGTGNSSSWGLRLGLNHKF